MFNYVGQTNVPNEFYGDWSGDSSMSLALILRRNDTFYYAADSRCIFTNKDGTTSIDDMHRKIFCIPTTNTIVIVTGDDVYDDISAEKLIASSTSVFECEEKLKQLNISALIVDKTDDGIYLKKELVSGKSGSFKNDIFCFIGHPNAYNAASRFIVPDEAGEEATKDFINWLFSYFIMFPSSTEHSIGGQINIFKQEYGHKPIKLQGWYDL